MIIIIKKDGQIVTDDGNPIEGKALEGAYMLLADAQDGDSIVYDGTNHMWKAGQGVSFDPTITDPQDGDTLVYNAAQQKWVNGAGAGGVLVVHEDPETHTLDKTWKEIHDALQNYLYCIIVYSLTDSETGAQIDGQSRIRLVEINDGIYTVLSEDLIFFKTDSEDGYPVNSENNG